MLNSLILSGFTELSRMAGNDLGFRILASIFAPVEHPMLLARLCILVWFYYICFMLCLKFLVFRYKVLSNRHFCLLWSNLDLIPVLFAMSAAFVWYLSIPIMISIVLKYESRINELTDCFNNPELFTTDTLSKLFYFGDLGVTKKKLNAFNQMSIEERTNSLLVWAGPKEFPNKRALKYYLLLLPFVILCCLAFLDIGYVLFIKF